MKVLSRALLASILAVLAGCASSGRVRPAPSEGAVRSDLKTVSDSELAIATQPDLLAYLQAERPQWLTVRNPGARKGRAGSILVYVDETRLGAVETLRTISPRGVRAIRYYDAAAAQAKFTTRDAGAVIQVILR